ncbi:right-handed parallel beta-helix repeat-containing protein [Dysgonomonas sp. Marseille-P4677]|uniref:right-handed parallel beta-helix repeat-containing protein n=1 Tax=Dysgonomonas sp. Marseille-P4677 TaxID=2364790 RepID=UPI001911ADE6|nr:right-handed parallel beta-helix repeat-containing protein [Dysgonomonas sp. Marseille-P4677]MBK5721381.1 right-handed parallel beta-helix repeat-containing protein [Dysgonomonas sp. Marseille-P4677]
MDLIPIKTRSDWGTEAASINENFKRLDAAKDKHKGYFSSPHLLEQDYPNPEVGFTAYVGTPYPGVIYKCDVVGIWKATTQVPDVPTINLNDYAKTETSLGSVIRTGELAQETGQDVALAVSQKAWTNDSLSKDKNTLNVSQLNDRYDYLTKQEARDSVPTNFRALGQSVSYRLSNGEVWIQNINFTKTQGYYVEYNTGKILAYALVMVVTIPLSGINRIKVRIHPTTGVGGGAFYNSAGTYISGFIFNTDPSNVKGSFREVPIPLNAVTLKTTYWIDSEAVLASAPVWDYIQTIQSSVVSQPEWISEKYIGNDLSGWSVESNWQAFNKDEPRDKTTTMHSFKQSRYFDLREYMVPHIGYYGQGINGGLNISLDKTSQAVAAYELKPNTQYIISGLGHPSAWETNTISGLGRLPVLNFHPKSANVVGTAASRKIYLTEKTPEGTYEFTTDDTNVLISFVVKTASAAPYNVLNFDSYDTFECKEAHVSFDFKTEDGKDILKGLSTDLIKLINKGFVDITDKARPNIINGGIAPDTGMLYTDWTYWMVLWMYALKPDTDYKLDLTGYNITGNVIHLYKTATDTVSTIKIAKNTTNQYAFNSGSTPFLSFNVKTGINTPTAQVTDIRSSFIIEEMGEVSRLFTLGGRQVLDISSIGNNAGTAINEIDHLKRYKQVELPFDINDINKKITDNTSEVKNLYVSSSAGVDTNNGTASTAPVKTIDKALALASAATERIVYIRLLNTDTFRLSGAININIAGKDLRFVGYNSISFDSFDSPRPTIKGSRLLSASDFTLVSTGVYRIPVTQQMQHFIAVNGEMRLPASTIREGKFYESVILPKLGAISAETVDNVLYLNITFPAADIAKLATEYTNAYITVFKEWISYKSKILSVNTTTNKVRIAQSTMSATTQTAWSIQAGDRYIIENINTALSVDANRETFAKGTFYTKDGYLYYKLKDDETIGGISVELPETSVLFNISGKCSFSGINFSQTYHNFFEEDSRFSLDTSQGRTFPCAILASAESLVFANCGFSLFARNVINFMNDSKDSYIYNSTFHDLGAGVMRIGEYDQSNQTATNVPYNIHIHNCAVKNTSKILQQASGIMITFADSCSVTNCDMSLVGYSGITFGYAWEPSHSNPTSIKNIRIAYNNIHHTCNFLLNDVGGIYTLGNCSGSIIENNIIHDIHSSNKLSSCVYLDEGSTSITVRNNLLYGAPYLFFSHQGNKSKVDDYLHIYNNIMAYPLTAAIRTIMSYGDYILRNIIYYDVTQTIPITGFIRIAFNNTFDNGGGTPLSLGPNTLRENPKFVNPKGLDFRFVDFDTIDKIGFEIFDTSVVGCKGGYLREFAKIPDDELALFRAKVKAQYGTTSEIYK